MSRSDSDLTLMRDSEVSPRACYNTLVGSSYAKLYAAGQSLFKPVAGFPYISLQQYSSVSNTLHALRQAVNFPLSAFASSLLHISQPAVLLVGFNNYM